MSKQKNQTSKTRPGRASERIHGLPKALRRSVFRPRRTKFGLSTFEVAGPLSFTRGGMYCWFVLGGQPWDFRTTADRVRRWDQLTFRLASLRGRTIKLRVTTRPYPSFEFARSLDEDTPEPLPTADGGQSWDDYLSHAQRRLRTTGLDQKLVALGVWVGPNPKPKIREELATGTEHPDPETLRVLQEILKVERAVQGEGLNARRVSPRDMAFLFHRSLSMGVPVPAHAGVGGSRWEPDDLAAFSTRREWLYEPLGSTVRVIAEQQGHVVERHVSVMTLGLMPELTWPENGQDPWMLAANKLPFPVEWSLSGAVMEAKQLESTIEGEQLRAAGIAKHYASHDLIPPPAVGRAIRAATENLDEVTEGDTRTAARFSGPIRLATYADTEEACLDQARELIDFYGERFNIEVHQPRGQAQLLREFIPGEPWSTVGFQRRMPVRYLASSMPHVDADLGTPTGPYVGYGIGSARRAVRFDPHYGPEHLNTPGLFPIVAEPGGGKSVLIGALAFSAARRGEPTIILDPSGPLARLCEMPELASHSRVLDLTSSTPGTLSPYQLIPEPVESAYVDDQGRFDKIEFTRAGRRAVAERQQLMFDVLRMWLPSSVLRESGTDVLLRESIRSVRQRVEADELRDTQTNPRWILEALADQDSDLARHLVAEINAAAEFPLGELVMPSHSDPIEDSQADEKTLVVVTMPGLTPPPEGVDREHWGSEERYTQPLLHLAAFFTSRFIYGRPRNVRKNVFLDENHLMGQWGSGRALFVRLSTDSRKWNTAVGAASQHPDDHLGIGRVDALMGAAFVGRLTKRATAELACQLAQCPVAYAPVIQGLSPKPHGDQGSVDSAATGEFVHLDPLGRVGKLRIDLDWYPGLREALQTTPGRVRQPAVKSDQPTPFIDAELFDMIKVIPIQEEEAAA